ncbi:MAG: hypothetical protein Q8888_01170, partial [Vigna little leaf phytoplasma]|nr:hypothetical protein [Vigna little leaf phytoplasma]
LTTTDLGEIQNQQDSTIKEAITSKNASLQGKNVSLSNITDNSADVTCGDYTGTVKVTFTVKPALSTVLTTTDLGEIQNQQDSTIKEAITSKNASLQGKNVSLSNITDNSADVTCGDYTGTVKVTFTVKSHKTFWIIFWITFSIVFIIIGTIAFKKYKEYKESE